MIVVILNNIETTIVDSHNEMHFNTFIFNTLFNKLHHFFNTQTYVSDCKISLFLFNISRFEFDHMMKLRYFIFDHIKKSGYRYSLHCRPGFVLVELERENTILLYRPKQKLWQKQHIISFCKSLCSKLKKSQRENNKDSVSVFKTIIFETVKKTI